MYDFLIIPKYGCLKFTVYIFVSKLQCFASLWSMQLLFAFLNMFFFIEFTICCKKIEALIIFVDHRRTRKFSKSKDHAVNGGKMRILTFWLRGTAALCWLDARVCAHTKIRCVAFTSLHSSGSNVIFYMCEWLFMCSCNFSIVRCSDRRVRATWFLNSCFSTFTKAIVCSFM